MLFETPDNSRIRALCAELEKLTNELSQGLDRPRPWIWPLRRQQKAESWASSITIEGFRVSGARAERLAAGESEPAPGDEDEAAFSAYAMAMEHVAVLAVDPRFEWNDRVILDLHFESCRFQEDKHPGLLRSRLVSVTKPGGGTAYVGPAEEDVDGLMDEFVKSLKADVSESVTVAAAMAHLNLVSIHPFEDGNGRVSRIVQSLVLARERRLAPEFGSIEPYLASHTDEYYGVLMEVQGGHYDPSRDAAPWVEFCLEAHIAQARARLAVLETAADRWVRLEGFVADRGWNDRLTVALEQALHGSTDRTTYVGETGVSAPTASGDLRRLTDAGLLAVVGAGRSTAYEPTELLRQVASGVSR